MKIPKPVIKIYTHYEIEFERTIITVVHMVFDNHCLTDSFTIRGNITKNIIEVCDSIFIKLAIKYGGFYLDEKYINIKEEDIDKPGFNFEGKRYKFV